MSESRELPFPSFDDDRDIAERLVASYAAMPPAGPEQVDHCVRAVLTGAMHAPARRNVFGGVRPRWWWGAAAAAVLVAVVMRPWRPDLSRHEADSAFSVGTSRTEPVGATREEQDGAIRFDLTLPTSAAQVAIVGDFNGWDDRATPMAQRAANGTWSARVPLPPGRHVYAFVVDGKRWLVDPLAPQVPDAGYGPTNAVIVEAPR
jgi:hypothetical protein